MGRLISTHALREEGDLIIASIKHLVVISTHALREEGDLLRLLRPLRIFDFYPRPPRGGRRKSAVQSWDSVHFYPRPPRGGRRPGTAHSLRPSTNFYPRPPRGGRRSRSTTKSWSNYFYPRPPRGGRPATSLSGMSTTAFLPTPSARRATANVP